MTYERCYCIHRSGCIKAIIKVYTALTEFKYLSNMLLFFFDVDNIFTSIGIIGLNQLKINIIFVSNKENN